MPVTFNKGLPSQARHILCYGDSLTAGYCSKGQRFEPYARMLAEKLADAGAACKISFCGHSGCTTEEMVHAATSTLKDVVGLHGKGLIRILEEEGPFDLVIIMSGTNDMGFGSEDAQILDWLRTLHGMCHERNVPTVALAPPPAPVSGAAREVERKRFVGLLRRLSRTIEGVVACMDPAEHVPGTDSKLWDPDGLHFSPAGSRALGRGLAVLAMDHVFLDMPSSAALSKGMKQAAVPSRAWHLQIAPPMRQAAAPTYSVLRRLPVYAGA